jgi:hypothetical protein
MDTDIADVCIRALKAARPYLITAPGSRTESLRVGVLLDVALARLGAPQDKSDWR